MKHRIIFAMVIALIVLLISSCSRTYPNENRNEEEEYVVLSDPEPLGLQPDSPIILDYKTDKFKEYDSLILYYLVYIENPFRRDSIHKNIKVEKLILKENTAEMFSHDGLSLYGKNRWDEYKDNEVFLCSMYGEGSKDSLRDFMLEIHTALLDALFKNTYSVDENDWVENRWRYSKSFDHFDICGRVSIR